MGGTPGINDGQLNLPWGIEIDSHGDVWIADWRNDRIQKFSADAPVPDETGRPR